MTLSKRGKSAFWLLHPWRAWAQRQTHHLWAEHYDRQVVRVAEMIAAQEASRIEAQG